MMLQRALTGACRSASRLQLQATATRSLMMMAGGDIPAPMSGTVKRFDSKKVRFFVGSVVYAYSQLGARGHGSRDPSVLMIGYAHGVVGYTYTTYYY